VHPQAVGAVLATRPAFGRYAVVATGDPVQPPLRVFVEAAGVERADLHAAEDDLRRMLGASVELTALAPGSLPIAEHKTRLVYRLMPGAELPPALAAALDRKDGAE
jgi:hypothetical protein